MKSEPGAADERGGDEVAERQREGEDRAGREARQDQRHEDRAKRAPAAGSEIGRGLDVGVGHAFDRRPHRQDHEWQPDVAEHDPHRPVGVADVHRAKADVPEHRVEDPVFREYQPPRVYAHEVARPERDQHRHEQGALQSLGCQPCGVEGEWHRQDRVGHGHRRGDPDRAQRDRAVDGHREKRFEVVERPAVDEVAGEGVHPPQRRDEQQHERRDVDQHEPCPRRGQQQGGPQPRPAEKRRRHADAGRSVGSEARAQVRCPPRANW